MMNLGHFQPPHRHTRCKPAWVALLAAAFLAGTPAVAQQGIAAGATNYTQDFDALTNGTWTDGSTLTGWYARTSGGTGIAISTYGANTGATTTGGLYAFGITGTNPSSDRALGYAPSNGFTGNPGTGYLGWRLKNNTGSAITALTVTWTGEQWRKDNAASQSLILSYQQGATVTNLTAGTWINSGSSFTSPNLGTGGLLDGNAPGNRTAGIAVNITVAIPAGEEIMLRWEDLNDAGNDHFLAIDNVTVNATTVAPTCGITLGTSTTACNANTPGVDTYNLLIPYTGMDAGTSVVNNSASGTVAGDNPASVTNGTIIISGINEGDAYNVGFTSPCASLTVSGASPVCVPAPVTYTLAAWDFTGESSPATSTADVYNANLDASNVLTRGAGAASSTASNSFRSTGFSNNGIATSNTDYFQSTLSAAPGYTLSLATIHARVTGTTSYSASPGASNQFAYSLDGSTFTLIGSPSVTIGTNQTFNVDVSGISALQNVADGTTVTFRYYATGQTNTGGWGFYSDASGNYGLALDGSVNTTGPVCNISLGTPSTACNANTPGVDTYNLLIPYTGMDAGTSVVNNSASGTVAGDNPASVTNGTIIISGINEGDAYNVTFTAPCASHTVSGPSPACVPACSVTFGTATATCNTVTIGNGDTYTVSIPYTGSQAGVTVVNNSGSGTVGGNDPAVTANGTIVISGISETNAYSVALSAPCGAVMATGAAPNCTPGPLAAWDFTGESNVATSTAEVYNASLDASSLITRGAGAGASTGNNSFRTAGFQNNGISTSNTDYFQVTLSAIPGQSLSLSTIDAGLNGTSGYAVSPGVSQQFAYSLDGTNFTLIGSPTVTIGQPTTLPQINLSGVAALQNVGPSTTITLRYYASGQTGSGGWGFFSSASGVYGLAIGGVLNPVVECAVSLGTPSATCNSITVGSSDTYNLSIPYTGMHSGVVVINNSGSGTVGGNDPATVSGGTIVISGISETNAYSISLSGDCNFVGVSGPAPICEPPPVLPTLVINEVDYDQPGDDLAEFIEIKNTGSEPVSLNGLKLVLVNGTNNSAYAPNITFGNVMLAAGDYYVVGSSNVPNVDLVVFNSTLPINQNLSIQNGAPDGIRLTTAANVVIDQMSYEGTMSTTEGSSAPTDPGNPASAGLGLSRMPDGADTNDNSVDFVLTCLTPGVANGGADSDNDGTPDCIDHCPLGPEPGSPCNDGNEMTADDTVQEDCNCLGIALDCEGVPGGPAMPGEPCIDGNPGTINDTWTAQCQCVGQMPDCLGVIGGTALPGTPCNDFNPSTNDEVWNASCGCTGTPCSQNVVLDLRSDANSAQVGWEILYQNDGTVVCSGGTQNVPYTNGITNPITEPCCLPVGCFRLRVMDSGGDGFVSGGITGGYQLRESGANGRRIIDNFGNFSSGSLSAIANTYDNGAFCVPLGNDRPIFTSCDKQDWVANQYIVATENTSVSAQYGVTNTTSGYEFWFFDPNGTYSFRRFRNHATTDGYGTGAIRACHFRLNSWTNTVSTPWLPNGVLLNVRVRGRVNGNNLPFGPACLFKMDAARAACPLVKLQDNPGNVSDYSCGVSRVFGGANSGANKLVANPPQFTPALPNASTLRYQFRFRLPGEYPNAGSCIVRPIQTSPTLYMNWTTGDKLKCNTQYQVDLRVSKDGGATWCVADGESTCSLTPTIWGKVCNVNITTSTYCPGPAQGGASNLSSEDGQYEQSVVLYPNPNRGDQLFLSLSKVEGGVRTVSVDIYDLTGKRAVARTIPVQDGFLKTNLDLKGDLANGMYMVNITAGEKTYTQRLVIQH